MTKIRLVNRKTTSGGSVWESSDDDKSKSASEEERKAMYLKYRVIKGVTRPESDEFVDSQFKKPPVKLPVRSCLLACFLCASGIVLLTLSFLSLTGKIEGSEDRIYPFMVLGLLTFIPGAYHTQILMCVLFGVAGYSYEDIPEFD